jgi:glycosyltransferase involved in cell wall biosynthesis
MVMVEAVLHRLIGSYQRCVSKFVVPSRFYAEKLVEWGVPADKFRHIPNFVDVARYEPRFAPGDSFVYFGRLSREKGLHTLVRAVARANCSLAIVGTGPELNALRQLAAQLGASVEFTGFLTGPKLHEVIRNSRAVVLPSEWYENAPMSVLEAYALGKPVVGASIGGIPELIQDAVTGIQFPSGDVAALAGALGRILSSPDSDLADMGRAGRRWVETEFTSDIYRSRVLGVYRELGVTATGAVDGRVA